MTVKIDIISGFLGAGKTTMINKLLDNNTLGDRIAIIENEFGDINIDSNRIGQSEIEIKSITSGCICCSLAGDFDLAMRELIEMVNPDRIIIEPTGVGKLSDIIKVVDKLKALRDVSLNLVVAIVDVLEYEDFIEVFGMFYKDQIENANTVILSKTQLADEGKVDGIIDSIRRSNPRGNIISVPWDKLEGRDILALAETKYSPMGGCRLELHRHHHGGGIEFQYWTMETSRSYDRNTLNEILSELKKDRYGNILRAKGVLPENEANWMDFDYLPKSVEIREFEPQAIGQIAVIGTALNKEELRKLWE